MLGVTSLHAVEVFRLQHLCHRPRATADLSAIQFTDRGNFSRGAGEEHFISNIDLVRVILFSSSLGFGNETDYRVPGNALQCGSQVRGVDHSVSNHKDIFPGTFHHIAGGVQH